MAGEIDQILNYLSTSCCFQRRGVLTMSYAQLPAHLDAATRRRLERDFADLRDDFTPLLGADVVDECLDGTLGRLTSEGQATPFVPLLAQRFARQELRAMAQSAGTLEKRVPEVLFIDVHDAARSQIAAALLDHRAGGGVHIRTAGTSPSADINPVVTAVLARRGLSTSRAYAKPLTEAVVRAADVIVTLGSRDAVADHGQPRFDWDLPDPEGKGEAEVAALCDDLDGRVRDLLAFLQGGQ
jgi:protein-tyrosine-phosphatase